MGQMKAQIPAVGILKRSDYGHSKSYQIVCECCDPDHYHYVWVDSDDAGVSVRTLTLQKSQVWKLNRWKTIWILLTKGYVEYEADIVMTEQQALNYAETLKSAVSDVKNFRKTIQT